MPSIFSKIVAGEIPCFKIAENDLAELMVFSKPIAKAIEKVIPCKRIGVSVIGLEVPHAHVHLIPINGVEEMNFAQPKISIDKTEMVSIAEKIRSFL